MLPLSLLEDLLIKYNLTSFDFGTHSANIKHWHFDGKSELLIIYLDGLVLKSYLVTNLRSVTTPTAYVITQGNLKGSDFQYRQPDLNVIEFITLWELYLPPSLLDELNNPTLNNPINLFTINEEQAALNAQQLIINTVPGPPGPIGPAGADGADWTANVINLFAPTYNTLCPPFSKNSEMILVNTSAFTTLVNLSCGCYQPGQVVEFKDISNNASINNITINAGVGNTIDGSQYYTIDSNNDYLKLVLASVAPCTWKVFSGDACCPAEDIITYFSPNNYVAAFDNVKEHLIGIDTKFNDITLIQTDISNIETDITNLQNDVSLINVNMGTINTAISNLSTQVSTISTTVSTLSSQVSLNTADIISLDSRVDALELSQATQNTDITNLQTDVLTLQTDVSTLQTDVFNINTSLTILSNTVISLQTDVTNLQTDVATLISQVNTNTLNIATLTSDVSILQVDVNNLQLSDATQNNDILVLQTDLAALQIQVNGIDNIVYIPFNYTPTPSTDIESHLTGVDNAFGIINGDINALQTDMFNAQSDISVLQASMTVAQADIITLQGNVSALQSNDLIQDTDIFNLQTDVTTLQSDVLNIQNTIDNLSNNTYFVDKNGNDTTGIGSELLPFLTISKALTEIGTASNALDYQDMTKEKYKIVVGTGVYVENLSVGVRRYVEIELQGGAYIDGNITINVNSDFIDTPNETVSSFVIRGNESAYAMDFATNTLAESGVSGNIDLFNNGTSVATGVEVLNFDNVGISGNITITSTLINYNCRLISENSTLRGTISHSGLATINLFATTNASPVKFGSIVGNVRLEKLYNVDFGGSINSTATLGGEWINVSFTGVLNSLTAGIYSMDSITWDRFDTAFTVPNRGISTFTLLDNASGVRTGFIPTNYTVPVDNVKEHLIALDNLIIDEIISYGSIGVPTVVAPALTKLRHIILIDTSGTAPYQVTLPTLGLISGIKYRFVDKGNNANTQNITLNAGIYSIDGSVTYVMNNDNQATEIVFDGIEWKKIDNTILL